MRQIVRDKFCETNCVRQINLRFVRSYIVNYIVNFPPPLPSPPTPPTYLCLLFYSFNIKLFTFELLQFQVHLLIKNIKPFSPYFVLFPNSSVDFSQKNSSLYQNTIMLKF